MEFNWDGREVLQDRGFDCQVMLELIVTQIIVEELAKIDPINFGAHRYECKQLWHIYKL